MRQPFLETPLLAYKKNLARSDKKIQGRKAREGDTKNAEFLLTTAT
jgi:hypothetical protein